MGYWDISGSNKAFLAANSQLIKITDKTVSEHTVTSLRTTLTRCLIRYNASKNRSKGDARYFVLRPGKSCSTGVTKRAKDEDDINTGEGEAVDPATERDV